MTKEELNNLAEEYRLNPTDDLFSQIYSEVSTKWGGKKLEITANDLGVDELDLQAAYDDAVMYSLEKFTDNFDHYLNMALKNRRRDLGRRKATVEKNETHITATDGESDAATLDNLLAKEGKVIHAEFFAEKKRRDQRQLIASLTENNIDSETTAIVTEVLADETLGKFRPTGIAKKLNVHHSAVTRKLAKLKNNYDSTVFGDYRDYLCV